MSSRRGRGRPRHPDLLTPAEWAVLDLVRHGMRRAEIARRRGTGVNAVKYHLANIGGKLGVGARELRHWPGIPNTTALARARRRNEHTMSTAPATPSLAAIGQVLGLPHVFTFGDLTFFDADGTRLYLHRKDEADWRPSSVLYFLVDDIHASQESLSASGVHFSGAPHVIYTDDATGIEEWMTFFEDGEGNILALMSRVAP